MRSACKRQDYETDRVFIKDLYTGMRPGGDDKIAGHRFHVPRERRKHEISGSKKYFPNEYCALIDETNPKKAALAKVDATGEKLVPIIDCREGVWGIKPRNREQHFALDALLDDRINLVTLMGKAGTGKTLLAMAAGLEAHGA